MHQFLRKKGENFRTKLEPLLPSTSHPAKEILPKSGIWKKTVTCHFTFAFVYFSNIPGEEKYAKQTETRTGRTRTSKSKSKVVSLGIESTLVGRLEGPNKPTIGLKQQASLCQSKCHTEGFPGVRQRLCWRWRHWCSKCIRTLAANKKQNFPFWPVGCFSVVTCNKGARGIF